MTTKAETFTKQVPIALVALGQHIQEHGLQNPDTVDIYEAEHRIVVRVFKGPQALQAWLNTVAIDNEVNQRVRVGSAEQTRTTWTVRLPNLGIRFDLVTLRTEPFLSAVHA